MPPAISIVGGALAGSAAAIAARQAGADVTVYEKTTFPRHKVCGEFLSSGVEAVFQRLEVWDSFLSKSPARMTKLSLHFPRKSFHFALPVPCWGLSRYVLDAWLMERAVEAGAEWCNALAPETEGPTIIAHGRKDKLPKGDRLFGFKAHHLGPPSDAIELHFVDGGYVGVSPAENGIINVCGLGPESIFREHRFRYDEFCMRSDSLRRRRAELDRTMDWLTVGPLVYRSGFHEAPQTGTYPAGDALGFVDPFTGTGMMNALLSGSLAGTAAASGQPVEEYIRQCRRLLVRPFWISSVFRKSLASGLAERAVSWMPGSLLFRLTRAQIG